MKKKSLIVAVVASISLVACGEPSSTTSTTTLITETNESVSETTVTETSTEAKNTAEQKI